MTIQRGSWSWDRKEDKMSDFFSATELLWTLISTTAWNGTLVMNIGPAADGRIPPIFLDRFQEIGEWIEINGEAIYGSRVWAGALPTGSEGAQPGGFQGAANATYYTSGTAKSGCQFGQSADSAAAAPRCSSRLFPPLDWCVGGCCSEVAGGDSSRAPRGRGGGS